MRGSTPTATTTTATTPTAAITTTPTPTTAATAATEAPTPATTPTAATTSATSTASTAYHPQTDGQTERLNQVVEQLLRTACKDDISHWDIQLPTLEFAYNNAPHAATGKTPFFLYYGREPLTPQQPTTPTHVQAAHDFVTTMQQLWEKIQRRLTTMQTSQKQYADRQRRDHSVAVRDQPQRPPSFDASQRGGPTVQVWLFTLNVFFYANYVSEDTEKIRYSVSLLRGPAMDWWRVIVTKAMDYANLLTQEGQTGPWAPSYFVEVPQYRTWDTWCTGLRARFEPIAASIEARQKLHTWGQLGSVQDYTSGFLALCEQVRYMHESERIGRYIGSLKHDIAQEIQLRSVTDFQEILAMAEKLEFFRRPRPGSYGSNSN
ncbi:unnamed protein product [Closterium sp. NIES-53]